MPYDNCNAWREKFEQLKANGRIAIEAGEKMIDIIRHERDDALQQLAAKDQEIARLREALERMSVYHTDQCESLIEPEGTYPCTCGKRDADAALGATAQPNIKEN